MKTENSAKRPKIAPCPHRMAQHYNITVQRAKEMYAANAKALREMYGKAVCTGKKVNGYTADDLLTSWEQYHAASI